MVETDAALFGNQFSWYLVQTLQAHYQKYKD